MLSISLGCGAPPIALVEVEHAAVRGEALHEARVVQDLVVAFVLGEVRAVFALQAGRELQALGAERGHERAVVARDVEVARDDDVALATRGVLHALPAPEQSPTQAASSRSSGMRPFSVLPQRTCAVSIRKSKLPARNEAM